MSFESLISNLIYPIVIAIGVGLWKLTSRVWSVMNNLEKMEIRIIKLEDTTSQHVTEAELRRILSDKIDPIKEDISDVKKQTEKITDILLQNRDK